MFKLTITIFLLSLHICSGLYILAPDFWQGFEQGIFYHSTVEKLEEDFSCDIPIPHYSRFKYFHEALDEIVNFSKKNIYLFGKKINTDIDLVMEFVEIFLS